MHFNQFDLNLLRAALAGPVREALLRVQSAMETRPTFDPAAARRTFRVAMSDYASFTLLPLFMRKLAMEAPGMTCHVEGITSSSFERLESGDLDFHLCASDFRLYGEHAPTADVRSMPLFRDDFVCVIDRNHPDIGTEMTLDLYQRLPHNVVRLGSGVTTIIEQGWRDAQLALNIAAIAPTFSALLFMLPGTRLVATAQRRLATPLAASLALRVLECPAQLNALQLSMARKRDIRWSRSENCLSRGLCSNTIPYFKAPVTGLPMVHW
jgi:DNA-binding transcriptional LysR family regulator